LSVFLLLAAVESNSLDYQFEGWQSTNKPWTYKPGDLGFDPLDLRTKPAEQWAKTVPTTGKEAVTGNDRVELMVNIKENVDIAEIWHGRAAMLAITGFAFQEALWQTPVVDQTPIFFATPVWRFLGSLLG